MAAAQGAACHEWRRQVRHSASKCWLTDSALPAATSGAAIPAHASFIVAAAASDALHRPVCAQLAVAAACAQWSAMTKHFAAGALAALPAVMGLCILNAGHLLLCRAFRIGMDEHMQPIPVPWPPLAQSSVCACILKAGSGVQRRTHQLAVLQRVDGGLCIVDSWNGAIPPCSEKHALVCCFPDCITECVHAPVALAAAASNLESQPARSCTHAMEAVPPELGTLTLVLFLAAQPISAPKLQYSQPRFVHAAAKAGSSSRDDGPAPLCTSRYCPSQLVGCRNICNVGTRFDAFGKAWQLCGS